MGPFLSDNTLKIGDIVQYGPRLGLILEEDSDLYTGLALYKIFFFDVSSVAILDQVLLKKANEKLEDLKHAAFDWCECGQKFVGSGPHSSWCITKVFEKGDINEIINCVNSRAHSSLAQSSFLRETGTENGGNKK